MKKTCAEIYAELSREMISRIEAQRNSIYFLVPRSDVELKLDAIMLFLDQKKAITLEEILDTILKSLKPTDEWTGDLGNRISQSILKKLKEKELL